MDSCAVTENDPTVVNGGNGLSGSFISTPIHQQTTYTLLCTKENSGTFTDSAVVNIIPNFQEN